jgi:type IV pilus assembly protein PilO
MALSPIVAKIQKISPKTRLIIFGVVIALLLAGYIIQFRIPMNTQIRDLEKSISGLQMKIKENDEEIKKLDELKAEVKALEARLDILTKKLPTGATEVSGLLREIQRLVNQSGLVLKLWKPEKRKMHQSQMYEEIPISMVLTGGYHNAATFFDRVGKLTRIVNIMNIKMGGAKIARTGSVDVDINCTALTFAAVEKKVEPAPKTGKKVQ